MKGVYHIDKELIEQYLIYKFYSDELSGEGIDYLRIEEHLASCDECAEKAHAIFNGLKQLSEWTIFQDNQVLMNVKVIEALNQYGENVKDESIKQRIKRWVNQFKGLAGGSFKVLVDGYANGKRKTTKILNESLKPLTISNPLTFDYEIEMMPSRGPRTEKVINLNKLKSSGKGSEITINLEKKKRSIKIEYKADRNEFLPLAILLSEKPYVSPIIKPPVFNQKRKKWEIIFDNLQPGEYYFLFEPFQEEMAV